jgi:hypothetical protein
LVGTLGFVGIQAADGETDVDENVVADDCFGHEIEISLARHTAELHAADPAFTDFFRVDYLTRDC